MTLVTFDQIQVGRRFKAASGIIYLKSSNEAAKPVQKANGEAVTNGRITTIFYNTKLLFTPID